MNKFEIIANGQQHDEGYFPTLMQALKGIDKDRLKMLYPEKSDKVILRQLSGEKIIREMELNLQ